MRARLRAGLFGFAVALLAGCAQLDHLVPQTAELRTQWPQGVPRTVELTDVPFFPQTDYQCGPAALATALAYSGAKVTPDPLVKQVFLPARKGSLQLEMLAAPRNYARVSYELAPRYADVLREVAAGNPVVVLQDVGDIFTQWHYAVVNGFDYPSGTIYLRSGTDKRQEMPFTYFERTWIASRYWAMVVMPPDRIPVTANENGWVNAVIAMARVSGEAAALKGYTAALKRWPDNLPATIGLANLYHERGDYAHAVTILRAAQQRHPDSAILTNNLAQSLSDGGRHTEALATLDKVSDPHNPYAAEIRSTRQLILQRMAQQKAGNRK
ncbi:MAG TPA: PA2778 family cysteine peptidase [Ramlibacter sp.]|nr:PA2778 family cysteine peptidase [Ramlibacter sp.]